jgi:hypothetical protein
MTFRLTLLALLLAAPALAQTPPPVVNGETTKACRS